MKARQASRRAAAKILILALLLALSGCKAAAPQSQPPEQPSISAPTAPVTEPTAPPTETEKPTELSTEAPTEPTAETAEPAEDESWMLILVNSTHPIPEGYSVTLKELRNGHYVDERIYPQLQQMFDDARAVGIYPFVNESYRTGERQQQIMDNYIAGYEASGMSRAEAEKMALEVVAVPGTSEHQLGLALDLIAEFDADSTATWQWLRENCWRYGFILRYPEDKTEITGISFEPWHFRYVGAQAAKQIMEQGLCLEEYLEQP